ncbi:transposase, partial [Streptomyces xiamenensis]
SAHRGSVLAAVRASVLREAPYGPAGGLPHLVRVDGGADFLSKTVRRAFGLLSVPVHRVSSPRHKGGIERLNRTSMTRFFADLPRYTQAPRLDHRRRVGDQDPPLTFEAFVDLLRTWVDERNIGTEVRVRWMPHHHHEIDLYTFRSNRYLGRAFLSNEADEALREKVLSDRAEHSAVLRRALKRSGERRRERYLPSTQPELPVRALRMTEQEARAELEGTTSSVPRRRRTQPYRPLTPLPSTWARPGQTPAPPKDDAS